jgi:hypothetical protein
MFRREMLPWGVVVTSTLLQVHQEVPPTELLWLLVLVTQKLESEAPYAC